VTLLAIVVAALAGGVLSTIAAGATLRLSPAWIPGFVSFAVGALLGAVFLELLPHALEHASAPGVMLTVLVGLLAFFLLEKLVLWRHAHGHATHSNERPETEHEHALHDAPDASIGRPGLMILIGNSVHGFCDGIVIAASFSAVLKLKTDGVRLVSNEIKIGAGGHRYIFIHPQSAGGVLVELVESSQ
jgi:zinc and cadmium transporter